MLKKVYIGSNLSCYDSKDISTNQSIEFYFCHFDEHYLFDDLQCKELKFVGCFFGEGRFDDSSIEKATFINCYFMEPCIFGTFYNSPEETKIESISVFSGDVCIKFEHRELDKKLIHRDFEKIYSMSSIGRSEEEIYLFIEELYQRHIHLDDITIFLPIIMSGMHNIDAYVTKEILKFVLDKVVVQDLTDPIHYKIIEYALFWFHDPLIFPFREDFFQKVAPHLGFHIKSVERLFEEEFTGPPYSISSVLLTIHRLMGLDKNYAYQKLIDKVKEIHLLDIHNQELCLKILNLWDINDTE